MITVDFLLTSVIVILLPGTGVLYTLAAGLRWGLWRSIAAALGCTFGIIPAATASIVGLAAVFHTSALAFQIVKYLGVAYLFYLAWAMLRDSEDAGAPELTEERNSQSAAWVALNGTLINVLNPKLSLFFLAFLPQFVSRDSAQATFDMMLLAGVFMALTFLIFVGYGACASLARSYVIARPAVMRWFRRLFAGAFGFLGFKLAWSDN